jgi:hypothetical protein
VIWLHNQNRRENDNRFAGSQKNRVKPQFIHPECAQKALHRQTYFTRKEIIQGGELNHDYRKKPTQL